MVVDYRRSLLSKVPERLRLLDYLTAAARATPTLAELASYLEELHPGPGRDPRAAAQPVMACESRRVFVVAARATWPSRRHVRRSRRSQPLLAQARDVGLHLVVARRSGGASRALYEPVIQSLRDLAMPGLLLSGSPRRRPPSSATSGRVPAPAGRGRLITRDRGVEVAPADMAGAGMRWRPEPPRRASSGLSRRTGALARRTVSAPRPEVFIAPSRSRGTPGTRRRPAHVGGRWTPPRELQLAQDAADVLLPRSLGDPQPPRDAGVGPALGRGRQHLVLPGADRREGSCRRRAATSSWTSAGSTTDRPWRPGGAVDELVMCCTRLLEQVADPLALDHNVMACSTSTCADSTMMPRRGARRGWSGRRRVPRHSGWAASGCRPPRRPEPATAPA